MRARSTFTSRCPTRNCATPSWKDHRFITWKFRPGQRVQLQVPVETLADRIVLPVDAVAQDGAETYVFTPNGDHFDRRSVHVEYRDHDSVVIANDGSLFPGDLVAIDRRQQLQLALKNKSGGGDRSACRAQPLRASDGHEHMLNAIIKFVAALSA